MISGRIFGWALIERIDILSALNFRVRFDSFGPKCEMGLNSEILALDSEVYKSSFQPGCGGNLQNRTSDACRGSTEGSVLWFLGIIAFNEKPMLDLK